MGFAVSAFVFTPKFVQGAFQGSGFKQVRLRQNFRAFM